MTHLMWDEYDLEVTLLTPLLGTIAGNQDAWSQFQATKAPSPDAEIAASGDEFLVPELPTKGHTTFYTDTDGRPILRSYQIKGALKEWSNVVKKQLKVANLRHHVDVNVFVKPATMVLAEKPDGTLERPLRAMTMQGPRVTVVSSDRIDPGKSWTWKIQVLNGSPVTLGVLEAMCEFGEMIGIGQWRTGEYGSVAARITPRQ